MLSLRPCSYFPKYKAIHPPKCGCMPCREKFTITRLREAGTKAELENIWEEAKLHYRQLARETLTHFLDRMGVVIKRRETRDPRPDSGLLRTA